MPQSGRPARRAVSRPVCANEKNPALSVGRKLLGTSKRASHPARPVPAVAPHGPRCSAVACRSAIGRPYPLDMGRLRALVGVKVKSKAAYSEYRGHLFKVLPLEHAGKFCSGRGGTKPQDDASRSAAWSLQSSTRSSGYQRAPRSGRSRAGWGHTGGSS
jgi:hypothetical protein